MAHSSATVRNAKGDHLCVARVFSGHKRIKVKIWLSARDGTTAYAERIIERRPDGGWCDAVGNAYQVHFNARHGGV